MKRMKILVCSEQPVEGLSGHEVVVVGTFRKAQEALSKENSFDAVMVGFLAISEGAGKALRGQTANTTIALLALVRQVPRVAVVGKIKELLDEFENKAAQVAPRATVLFTDNCDWNGTLKMFEREHNNKG